MRSPGFSGVMRWRDVRRVDPVVPIREEAGFIGAGRARLFCVTYHPPSPPRGGVVICCPILAEQLKTYRTEVLAARAFAGHGFAVVRFHYLGTGHSGGVTEDLTVETMLQDVTTATAYLCEQARVNSLVFCGARWGGLIAGLAVQGRPGASLILWEPVIDGERYFRETFRASQISALANAGTSTMTVAQAIEEVRTAGRTDALGHPIDRGLYESANGRSLIPVAAGEVRAALLVQVSRRRSLKPEFGAWRAALEASGSVVETAFVEGDGAWSFVDSPALPPQRIIEVTLPWLNRRFPGGTG